VLKVREYFLFDPRDKTLAGVSLVGYRLINDQYELIPKTGGRLDSEVLGLHLEASGEQLRFYDPQRGGYLLTPQEIREAQERDAAARLAAEERAQREAVARAAAEERAQHEATARAAAEAEVERLRREIEALRRAAPPGP